MDHNQHFLNKNKSFVRKFSYAAKGISSIWMKESSFRFQSYCALMLFVFCLIAQPPGVWCALFTFAVVLVLVLESINTAIESLLDKTHPDHDPLIGFVKDCLAGAVLIASIGSVLIFIIFIATYTFPKLWEGAYLFHFNSN